MSAKSFGLPARCRLLRLTPAFIGLLTAFVTCPALADDYTIDPITSAGLYAFQSRGLTPDGSYITGIFADGSFLLHAFRWSAGGGVELLGELAGDTYSESWGISNNGQAITGTSAAAYGFEHGFYWTSGGGMIDIGNLGGNYAIPRAISGDGNTVIGYADVAGIDRPFRWTSSGGIEYLGTLGGTYGQALAVNANGTVIVGQGNNGTDPIGFRWVLGSGMTGITPTIGDPSTLSLVSADGNTVAGVVYTPSFTVQEAFRWTVSGGSVRLGTLGVSSYPEAMSRDGSIIVGDGDNGTYNQAFYWTAGTGLVPLTSPYTDYTSTTAVSDNGNTIVGSAWNGAGYDALRWSNFGAGEKIYDVLTTAGVDMTNWASLNDADGVSADGKVIYGRGIYLGLPVFFIMTSNGLITAPALGESLLPTVLPGQQVTSAIDTSVGQSLLVARTALTNYFPSRQMAQDVDYTQLAQLDDRTLSDIAPAAGGNAMRGQYAAYATGSLSAGHNNDFGNKNGSGSTGLMLKAAPDLAIGFGVIGSHTNENTSLKGSSHASVLGASMLAAYEPASGLRFYGTAAIGRLDVDTSRVYANGGGTDSSSGQTDGLGFGLSGRTGYEFTLNESTRIMPYIEAEWSHSQLGSYTETGGAFPAAVGSQTSDTFNSYLGAEVSHQFSTDLLLRVRGAWGHRYSEATSVFATAASISQTVTGDPGAPNWAEGGITGIYHLSDRTSLSADISGRLGDTSGPAIGLSAGLQVAF